MAPEAHKTVFINALWNIFLTEGKWEELTSDSGWVLPTVMSQALGYPTCRSGLVVLEMKGFLDRGFSSCTVLAFCHGPRYFEFYAGICTPQGP